MPMVYTRGPTIANKIFNYKQTVSSINCFSCDWKKSHFCDPHYGQRVTGDLRFINHVKLRNLLCKGPKYREKERINWKKKAYDSTVTGIDECKSLVQTL